MLLEKLKKIPPAALLFAAAALTFWPALQNGFVNWDDAQYVLNNPALRGSWSEALLFSPGYYHPLTTLSYKLELVLFGQRPFFFHLDSLLLHFLVCAAVFRFFLALGSGRGAALAGALLFCVHPLHVEPAAWVSGRKELLWALFFFSSLTAYLRYLDTARNRFFFLSLFLFVLAVLSKPFAVVTPLVLLLLDLYRGRRPGAVELFEKLPFLAAGGALFLLSYLPSGFVLKDGPAGAFGPAALLLSAVKNVLFYLWKAAWPFELSAVYPDTGPAGGPVYLLAGLAFCAAAAALYSRPGGRLKSAAALGAGFFLATLLPVLSVPVRADRFAYVPLAGLCFFYGELAAWLAAREGRRRLAAGLVSAHLALLGCASFAGTFVWRDSVALWSNALDHYPANHMANYRRGKAYMTAGDNQKAISDYTRCLELSPDFAGCLEERARAYAETGRFDKAVQDLDKALSLRPGDSGLLRARAGALLRSGDYGAAVKDYDSLLAANPGDPETAADRRSALSGLKKSGGGRRSSGQ